MPVLSPRISRGDDFEGRCIKPGEIASASDQGDSGVSALSKMPVGGDMLCASVPTTPFSCDTVSVRRNIGLEVMSPALMTSKTPSNTPASLLSGVSVDPSTTADTSKQTFAPRESGRIPSAVFSLGDRRGEAAVDATKQHNQDHHHDRQRSRRDSDVIATHSRRVVTSRNPRTVAEVMQQENYFDPAQSGETVVTAFNLHAERHMKEQFLKFIGNAQNQDRDDTQDHLPHFDQRRSDHSQQKSSYGMAFFKMSTGGFVDCTLSWLRFYEFTSGEITLDTLKTYRYLSRFSHPSAMESSSSSSSSSSSAMSSVRSPTSATRLRTHSRKTGEISNDKLEKTLDIAPSEKAEILSIDANRHKLQQLHRGFHSGDKHNEAGLNVNIIILKNVRQYTSRKHPSKYVLLDMGLFPFKIDGDVWAILLCAQSRSDQKVIENSGHLDKLMNSFQFLGLSFDCWVTRKDLKVYF